MGDAPLPGSEEVPEPNALVVAAKNVAGSLIDFVKQIDPVSKKEEAIQEIIENVGVDSQRKSNVVSISYDTKSPKLAQAVVKELIDQYMHEHSRIHATFGSHSFFDEQQKKLKKDVATTSEELRAAKDRYWYRIDRGPKIDAGKPVAIGSAVEDGQPPGTITVQGKTCGVGGADRATNLKV